MRSGGVLLSVVLDPATGTSFLLVLNDGTSVSKERAEAQDHSQAGRNSGERTIAISARWG
jgi:hypothetical protein